VLLSSKTEGPKRGIRVLGRYIIRTVRKIRFHSEITVCDPHNVRKLICSLLNNKLPGRASQYDIAISVLLVFSAIEGLTFVYGMSLTKLGTQTASTEQVS
jgi:hypothetical protein